MKLFCTVILLSLLSPAIIRSEVTKTPVVQQINRPYTPEFIDLGHLTTVDSATFTQPPVRTILGGTSTTIEVIPRCRIDSMIIFVHHSYPKIDTPAHLQQPPWRTEWKYADLPDQDQIHLQFGYQIFQPDGKIITSPSLPHQWVIDRTTVLHRQKYQCVQIVNPDMIVVDGKPDEWIRIRRAAIGNDGTFALCFSSATVLTPAMLFFLVEVHQREVLPTDIVELHLDPYRTRTSFASEKHRSILIAPAGRSYTFVADSVDAKGFRQCDSIAALVNDGMTWRAAISDSGYVLEAAIPFYSLTELKYPPRRFGLDVTIRSGGKPFHFAGWANNNEYARYNPGEWGTVVLRQATPLDSILLSGTLIVVVIVGTVIIIVIRNSAVAHSIIRKEATCESKELELIRKEMARHLGDATMSIATIATATGLTEEVISASLLNELDSTFEHFIGFARIENAKHLLADFTLPPETIAARCGFGSVDEMNQQFRDYLHTGSDEFRLRLRDQANDDEDISTHRSRSESLTPESPTDAPI